jgi:hypothetical protein
MARVRGLTGEEIDFATTVFGPTIDWPRVRLTTVSGTRGRAFTVPTPTRRILINIGRAAHAEPLTFRTDRYPAPGQLLIHELAHAWQIEHCTWSGRWLYDGIVTQLGQGGSAYAYGPPGPLWSEFGIEGQASIVDEWFGGNRAQAGPPQDPNGPYFDYIANNVRLGLA